MANLSVLKKMLHNFEIEDCERSDNESNLNSTLTILQNADIKKAYFEGYQAGLTNHLADSSSFDLDLTDELALSWLDGWLDGVEALEKQCDDL